MKRPTFKEIHYVMEDNDMTVFKRPYDVTLGGVRTKDNKSNMFNDWLFMSFFTERGGIVGAIVEGTTDAGLYYREHPMHVDGTAIIQHGVQHRGAYTYMKTGGHRGQEAFRQTGEMWYWRDADRDEYLDFGNQPEKAIYNTNGHDMGTRGASVDKWSAGCWGSTVQNMDFFYELARHQVRNGNGDKFSFAMLHEDMF